jgi:glycosyltransferase involved in cell wall biosynthesis
LNTEKRVALICQHFYPEMISTGLHMTELATGLAAEGVRLRVYSARPIYRDVTQKSPDEFPGFMVYKDVEVVRVPSFGGHDASLLLRGVNALSYLLFTAFYLIRDRKQLAGIINTTNPPFLGLAAYLARLVAGLRYVTIVYDVYPDVAVCIGVLARSSWLTWFWERITRFIFQRSAVLIVIGRDMEQLVQRKLKHPDQVPVVRFPNWSDAKQVYPVPRDDNPFVAEHMLQDLFVVQYSGRMGRTHNIEPLIEAARLLQDAPVCFQLIGAGAKRDKLQALAEQYGLQNVQFLPYQPFDELASVLSAPHLSVVCLDAACTGVSVPSKTYGIMASGRPILGFLAYESEIGRLIQEYDCGVVLPNPSGAAVAELITQLLNDPERVASMGHNGYQAFLAHYTLDHAIQRYKVLLEQEFGLYDAPRASVSSETRRV